MLFIDFDFYSSTAIILYSVVGICFITQVLLYFCLYIRLGLNKKAKPATHFPPISIIVCTENELEHLKVHLPILLNLNYPTYEVIVVDMNSQDDTLDYLEMMVPKYPNLYFSHTTKDSRIISKRKLAQTIGIKASKYDWLVFTEASCRPTSNNWLKEFAAKMDDKNEIILGYSKYNKYKGGFHRITAFDHITNSIRYLSLAMVRKPYTGLGYNMAYKRELFFREKGYINQLNLQRGEDEIFINSNATSKNIAVVNTKESTVIIEQESSSNQWRNQKISHFTSVRRFKGFSYLISGIDTLNKWITYLGSFIIGIIALINCQWIIGGVALGIFLCHWTAQTFTTNFILKRLDDNHRFYFSILYLNYLLPIITLIYKFKVPKYRRGDILKY